MSSGLDVPLVDVGVTVWLFADHSPISRPYSARDFRLLYGPS